MTSAGALPVGLLERVQERLAAAGPEPNPEALARAVRAETGLLTSDTEMLRIIRVLEGELIGAGPLDSLLAAADVTDVVVNGPADVRVDHGDGWEPAGVTFTDDAAVQRLARRLAASARRRLDEANPCVDATLPSGARLHAVLAPVAADGTVLSLRVLRPAADDLAGLQRRGAFPGAVYPVLEAIVRARLAFLVSGGTGCGKTTLLAALLGEVADTERIITVEDAAELRPRHSHRIRLVARTANVEGAGAVDLRELVKQALRMRPDRVVVGEVRGAEVVDLLVALNTGHDGGAGTVHANSAAEVVPRLEALAVLGGLDRAALHAQLGAAVQVVVHLQRAPDAEGRQQRQVAEIAVLVPDGEGWVRPVQALDAQGGSGPGAGALAEWLRRRGVPPPDALSRGPGSVQPPNPSESPP